MRERTAGIAMGGTHLTQPRWQYTPSVFLTIETLTNFYTGDISGVKIKCIATVLIKRLAPRL